MWLLLIANVRGKLRVPWSVSAKCPEGEDVRAPLLNKNFMYCNSHSFLAILKAPVCRVQIRVTPKSRWCLDSSFHASTCAAAKDEQSTIISLLFSSFIFECRGLPHIQCSPCKQEKVCSSSSQKKLIFFPDESYLQEKKPVFIRLHTNIHFYTHTQYSSLAFCLCALRQEKSALWGLGVVFFLFSFFVLFCFA